jgi:hypothetical protein
MLHFFIVYDCFGRNNKNYSVGDDDDDDDDNNNNNNNNDKWLRTSA